MSKHRTILVDQDGVLANYAGRFLELWREQYPEKIWVPLLHQQEHDMASNYPVEYKHAIEEIEHSPGFFRSLKPIPGGKEALNEMLAMGYDVRICTAPKKRYRNCVLEKFDWVAEHFGQEWVERIVLTRDKTLVRGEILIDDKPVICGACTPSWQHVLYDQPYNRTYDRQRITWANYHKILCG